jgi:3-oxoacyl-[acyl-carrier-protein] synthase-3
MSWSVRILGTGSALPATAVSAGELDRRLQVAPGTCLARNGVATRYFANAAETTSAMSALAIERALAVAGLGPRDLDAILFSGVMSEQPMPSTAVLIHRRLAGRAEGVTCFDINASCAGFLKGCETAATGIHSGLWRRVAVVAAEIASKGLDWADLDTCTLFGDGAAAAVLGAAGDGEDSRFLVSRSAMHSQGADFCVMEAGGSRFNVVTPPPEGTDYLFHMQGHRLLRLTQAHFPAFLDELLKAAPEVSLVIPHQASAVGLAFLRRQLAERGTPPLPFLDILAERGNQVSASLPTALDFAIRSQRLRRGESALLVATGAGLTMSGLAIRY